MAAAGAVMEVSLFGVDSPGGPAYIPVSRRRGAPSTGLHASVVLRKVKVCANAEDYLPGAPLRLLLDKV